MAVVSSWVYGCVCGVSLRGHVKYRYAVTKEAKTTGVLCGEVKPELCVLEGDEK